MVMDIWTIAARRGSVSTVTGVPATRVSGVAGSMLRRGPVIVLIGGVVVVVAVIVLVVAVIVVAVTVTVAVIVVAVVVTQ
jgi:hypothetical protein